ncbi:MAG: hypothetical protein ABFD80_06435 [Acidobacteriota bacterium]
MKKVFLVALAGLILFSSLLFFPASVSGARSAAECYDNYDVCRGRALNMDTGWIKVTLYLTVCDVSLGKCIILG